MSPPAPRGGPGASLKGACIGQLDMGRRTFIGSAAAVLTTGAAPTPDLRAQYIAMLKPVLLSVAGMGLCYFWDDDGKLATTGPKDVAFLQTVFQGFPEKIAPLYEFLMTKQFSPKPFSADGVKFYMPYGGDAGVPLDALMRQRFASLRRLALVASDGSILADYATPAPDLTFPKHADTLRLDFTYSGDEEVVGQTTPAFVRAGDGSATMTISTGFLRKVLLGCIYAMPVVQNSHTLLWQRLKLDPGPEDSVLVNTPNGRWSISLLPLLCVTDASVYDYKEDAKLFHSVHSAFYRVYERFKSLNSGGPLPSAAQMARLADDVAQLEALSQLYFLTLMFIISHETAHSVFMHESVPGDPAMVAEQEQAADAAATVHLFIVALTNGLNKQRSWMSQWRYSELGSPGLAQRLLWFQRLFGFGVANNIALRLLVEKDDPYHPTQQARWATNVRIWNNCALACSRTEPATA